MGIDILCVLAGQRTNVDSDIYAIRNRVCLHTSGRPVAIGAWADRVAREGGVRTRMEVCAQARNRKRVEERINSCGVEQLALRLLRHSRCLNGGAPQLIEPRRGAVRADARNDSCCGEQRVVGFVRRAAMPGSTAYSDSAPGNSLLADVDADERLVARPGVQAGAFGEYVVGHDRIALVVGHPLHAVRTTRFLVGNREENQIAFRAKIGCSEVTERDGHRCSEVQHVDGATPPYLAVDQLATERIVRPTRFVDRNDIGVSHQAQRRCLWIAAANARHQRAAARRWFVLLHVEAACAEKLPQQVGIANLEAGLCCAIVDTAIADELLQ